MRPDRNKQNQYFRDEIVMLAFTMRARRRAPFPTRFVIASAECGTYSS
jgi:hypothetical protein